MVVESVASSQLDHEAVLFIIDTRLLSRAELEVKQINLRVF